jgi:hypothetical protein
MPLSKYTDKYYIKPRLNELMKGQNMEIIGKERSLDGVVEGIIILQDVIEENKYNYRKAWRSWLPNGEEEGKMSYVPVVAMRKCYSKLKNEKGEYPYFIFILNQARDRRPSSGAKSKEAKKPKIKQKPKKAGHCKLCDNIIDKGMIISEIDDYYLTPNGFPYHNYASLLINKNKRPQHGDIRPEEIATWIKTSVLLDQYLFFNSPHAGASIIDHQHIQVVDPQEMKMDGEVITYPLLNDNFVEKVPVSKSPDVFRVKNYLVDALMFTGGDAPYKSAYAIKLLKDENAAFNILVNKNDVYVVGRNKERETSICMGRKVGGYEESGIAMLGDIEERSGEKNITIEGAKIFSNMSFDIVKKNIVGASIPLDSIVNKF